MKYFLSLCFLAFANFNYAQLRSSEEVFLTPQKFNCLSSKLSNGQAIEIEVVDDADWFLKYLKNSWKDSKGLEMSRTKTGWASSGLQFTGISNERIQLLFDTKKQSGKQWLVVQIQIESNKQILDEKEEGWNQLKKEIEVCYKAYVRDRYTELLDKVQKDYSMANAAVTKLNESMGKTNERIESAQKEIEKKNEEVKESEGKRQEEESTLGALEKNVNSIQEEIAPFEKSKKENEKLIREIEEEQTELVAKGEGESRNMKKLSKEKEDYQEKVDEYSKDIEKLEEKKRTASDKVDSQKEKVRAAKSQEDKAQAKVKEAEKSKSDQQNKLNELQSELKDESEKLRTLSEQITKLSAAMSVL